MLRSTLSLATAIALLTCAAATAQRQPQTSAAAAEYLGKALDVIEKNSKMRQTDWRSLRRTAINKSAGAQKPSDTYPAIRHAIASLNDHHSFFVEPDAAAAMMQGAAKTIGIKIIDGTIAKVYPGTPAERAELQPGMEVVSINGTRVTKSDAQNVLQKVDLRKPVTIEVGFPGKSKSIELTPEQANLLTDPSGTMIAGCGYVEVPEFVGNKKLITEYARKLQDVVRRLDATTPEGWIVDLRRNSGGNMWPMIAGLGPLLGDGTLGYFIDAHSKDGWWYRDGSSGSGKDAVASAPSAYNARTAQAPIAVLVSDGTMSSGEVVALSFSGMRNVRFFGEKTNGLTTANDVYPLADGAEIVLAVADETDRNGRFFPDGIPPDEEVPSDWRHVGNVEDPVVHRAIQWITKTRAR